MGNKISKLFFKLKNFMFKKNDKNSKVCIKNFDGFEIAYRKNTADELTINHSFNNDIFFKRIPEYKPKIGDVIIDVGSHIGTFSILASLKVDSKGKVYSIEASKDSFNFLKINKALNKCNNLFIYNLALSNEDGEVTLYHNPENWGHSIVQNFFGNKEIEKVRSLSLESFLYDYNIEKCNFIKFNCEGAEFPIILNSDKRTLSKINTMLILYHLDLWKENTEEELINHLTNCGFDCRIHKRTDKRGWIIAVKR